MVSFILVSGIHYVGNMEDGSMNRCLVDLLSDNQLKWEPVHDLYDTIVIGQPGRLN